MKTRVCSYAMKTLSPRFVGLMAALSLSMAPLGAQISPAGPDFQVNSFTTSYQQRAEIASLGEAGFVVVWTSFGSFDSDSDGWSVQAQRFSRSGLPLGGQFQVNSYTPLNQLEPRVDADAAGNFIVVWRSDGSTGSDTLGTSVQARRYSSSGTPLSGEFQVNSYTMNNQVEPAVSVRDTGEAVVVWGSLGSVGDDPAHSIQGQLYDTAGSPLGNQFQVNSYITGEVSEPSVTFLTAGDFAVVFVGWGSTGGDLDQSSIQARIFDSSGSPIDDQFQVNSYTTSYQFNSHVAGIDANNFVVAWESYGSSGLDSEASSIHGRLIDGDGVPLSGQFQVNQYTTGYQHRPSVSADGRGDFVIAWDSTGSTGTDTASSSIQARRYFAAGGARTSEFQVNSHTTGGQSYSAVRAERSGDFIVAWTSASSPGTDSSLRSVLARRFDGVFRDGFESTGLSRWTAVAP